jgi:hypothetical protein
MKKYLPAVLSWIACIAGFYISAAIVFKVVLPLLLKRVFGLSFPPTNGLGRAIQVSVVAAVIFLFYLVATKTGAGQKLVQRFLDANREIFPRK